MNSIGVESQAEVCGYCQVVLCPYVNSLQVDGGSICADNKRSLEGVSANCGGVISKNLLRSFFPSGNEIVGILDLNNFHFTWRQFPICTQ